ncbi:hypothetical protein D1AOALGA4SA_9407 [Olavius algarvensis Delta 1 endosymbiont]|nr:hypothetical protein D1AOALGA4SA_9407 [Olavius algarvensis Delta 1 endosymbiont]
MNATKTPRPKVKFWVIVFLCVFVSLWRNGVAIKCKSFAAQIQKHKEAPS